jgi:hypothetical protein
LEMEVKEMVVIHIPFSGLGQFVSWEFIYLKLSE